MVIIPPKYIRAGSTYDERRGEERWGNTRLFSFTTSKARQRNAQSSKLLKVERQSRGKFHEIVSEEFLICKETPPLLAGCVVLYSIVYLYYLLYYLY